MNNTLVGDITNHDHGIEALMSRGGCHACTYAAGRASRDGLRKALQALLNHPPIASCVKRYAPGLGTEIEEAASSDEFNISFDDIYKAMAEDDRNG
jgi:hypothetical protein